MYLYWYSVGYAYLRVRMRKNSPVRHQDKKASGHHQGRAHSLCARTRKYQSDWCLQDRSIHRGRSRVFVSLLDLGIGIGPEGIRELLGSCSQENDRSSHSGVRVCERAENTGVRNRPSVFATSVCESRSLGRSYARGEHSPRIGARFLSSRERKRPEDALSKRAPVFWGQLDDREVRNSSLPDVPSRARLAITHRGLG